MAVKIRCKQTTANGTVVKTLTGLSTGVNSVSNLMITNVGSVNATLDTGVSGDDDMVLLPGVSYTFGTYYDGIDLDGLVINASGTTVQVSWQL